MGVQPDLGGHLVGTDPSDSVSNWIVPGSEFYLGGGNDGNTYGIGVFDEVKIFDQYLTSAQVVAIVVPEPGTLLLLLIGAGFLALRPRM